MRPALDLTAYNQTRETSTPTLVCHAPFASLHLDPIGNAFVCDTSYRHPLGRYPEQSLKEIWFGAQAEQIRQWIRDTDLSHSCQRCLDELGAGNFHNVRARDYDWLARAEPLPGALPRVIEFDLSNECNLGCVMCNGWSSSWIRHHREQLPPLRGPYDDAFVAQLVDFLPGLELAAFVGGEPFMSRLYYQIWDLIAERKPELPIGITTNCTVWNDRIRTLLARLRCSITVSIDSLNKKTYERIRVNASFDEVMANLDHFAESCRANGMPLSLSVCPMSLNWREIPDIVAFCNRRHIKIIFNHVLHPAHLTLRTMNHSDLVGIVQFLQSRTFTGGSAIEELNLRRYQSFVKQIEAWRDAAGQRVPLTAEDDDGIRLRMLDRAPIEGALDPTRRAVIEWAMAILSRGEGQFPNLRQDLLAALESDGPALFVERYFVALEEICPLLHADAPDMPQKARKTAALISTHVHRDWYVAQIVRWDPDHVLTGLKGAPLADLEAWLGAQFVERSAESLPPGPNRARV